ncbi:MAG TPA: DUF86 domain-containing protein [Caldilineaceae bacterium]|nr:DUF86 domain-containing protein [Caldilineaceae bacterium]
MSERTLLSERLQLILEALERIPRRFANITTPDDFVSSQSGVDKMDSICMVLLAAGEEFKKIDRETEGTLFANYSQINWRGAIGLRDVLAHGYFQVDPEQLFAISKDNIPPLIETVKEIIRDLEKDVE